jgi:hypothetical protein
MSRYTDRRPKNQDRDADDGAELAVSVIAARFGLTHSTAKIICELARIGRSDDLPASWECFRPSRGRRGAVRSALTSRTNPKQNSPPLLAVMMHARVVQRASIRNDRTKQSNERG